MNGLRAAKYSVRAAYVIVSIFIVLVVAGPAAGFVTPRLGSQYVVGFGIDVGAIGPQVQQVFSGNSNLAGSHQITVPVHNRWFFQAEASLSLKLISNGQVLYQTQTSTVELAPFQSGDLKVDVQLSPGVIAQMQGKQISIGGVMSFGAPSQLWSLTMNFPQG